MDATTAVALPDTVARVGLAAVRAFGICRGVFIVLVRFARGVNFADMSHSTATTLRATSRRGVALCAMNTPAVTTVPDLVTVITVATVRATRKR